LGFSNGAIMQYNAGNGSLIKIINQYEVEKDGIIFYKFLHTKDVSSLYFFHQKRNYEKDNLLLISSSFDSTIQVYNEYFLETTTKLRTIKGGHTIGDKKCEIICMDFSDNLCQLATGSTEGLITIWDFEMSKIKEVFYFNPKVWGEKIDVLCLKYLNNYPLLFSSYTEGICCLWGVQPLDKSIKLILKFHNFYQTSLKLDLCDVLCCYFLEGVIKGVEQQFLNKKYFVDTPEFIKERKKKRFDQVTGDELPMITRDELEKESIIDKGLDPYTYQDIYDKYDKNTATKIKNNIINNDESQYLVICDKKGFIKILNLKGVFRKYRNVLINPESYHVLGSNFNILKKDDTNVESFLSHLIHISSTDGVKYFKQLYHNLYATNIISREWKGHLDAISDITFIEEPVSLVTISKDMHMRIWDEKFELMGEIDIFPSEIKDKSLKALVPWNFKINEERIIGKEINEVVEIFENVGLEPVIFGSEKDKENSKLKIVKKEEIKKKNKKGNGYGR
jgi:WD40 repeat protein